MKNIKNIVKVIEVGGTVSFALPNELKTKTPKGRIYTDAGFVLGKEKGIICSVIDDIVRTKEVVVPSVPGQKQFSNLLELVAVIWGLETTPEEKVIVYTDSKVIRSWFNRKENNLAKFSEYHFQAKEELEKVKSKKNKVSIRWIPRDENKAGIILEELARDLKHKNKSNK